MKLHNALLSALSLSALVASTSIDTTSSSHASLHQALEDDRNLHAPSTGPDLRQMEARALPSADGFLPASMVEVEQRGGRGGSGGDDGGDDGGDGSGGDDDGDGSSPSKGGEPSSDATTATSPISSMSMVIFISVAIVFSLR